MEGQLCVLELAQDEEHDSGPRLSHGVPEMLTRTSGLDGGPELPPSLTESSLEEVREWVEYTDHEWRHL